MFCLICQEKLTKAFKDEFGSEATITVSWEKGLGVVSVPTNGVITEEAFKKVVEKTGFKYSGIIRSRLTYSKFRTFEMFINKNPGIIKLKFFNSHSFSCTKVFKLAIVIKNKECKFVLLL